MNLAFSTINRTSGKRAENFYRFEPHLSNGISPGFHCLVRPFSGIMAKKVRRLGRAGSWTKAPLGKKWKK
jgi:hypothetical protein